MEKLKTGIIGAGVIGGCHLKALQGHDAVEPVGVTDVVADAARKRAAEFGIPCYRDAAELIEKARPDYVTVCTPHKSHAAIACEAMRRGVHAFVEKPLTVSAAEARRCAGTAKETGRVLGVNFLRRLRPANARLKELASSGFLGTVIRVTAVLTEWFRSMAYYRSGGWRGTWDGEGGGILVNQAPHDLDLIVWTLGPPEAVCADINTLGHDIEVEDDLCAMLRWPGGARGTLQVNTNEAPGRSFFEITGTKGTLLLEGNRLTATRLAVDAREFSEATEEKMTLPRMGDVVTYDLPDVTNRYALMHTNFAEALRSGAPLMCPGEDAVREVELANALLVSAIRREWVELPARDEEFEQIMSKLIETRNIEATRRALGIA